MKNRVRSSGNSLLVSSFKNIASLLLTAGTTSFWKADLVENHMTKDDLKRQMILLGHKVPFVDNGGSIKLHINSSGREWCYCESCHDLGALDTDARLYGRATTSQCRGSTPSRKQADTFAEP